MKDEASVTLSVVIPAYNEEDRLPVMLKESVQFLEDRRKKDQDFSYEIILVDDGSKDRTTQIGLQWVEKLGSNRFRVLTLQKNRGKGGAVRLGVLRARGDRILFADADGATKFEDLVKLEKEMDKIIDADTDYGIVCGSRAHLEENSIAERSYFRTFLMFGFHTCVKVFGARSIKDTQCGFKLLSRPSARICFSSLHIERWAFDVELLKIGEILDMPLGEVAVRWTEIDGSKLSPLLASIQMFKDLFLLWVRYRIGAWKIRKCIE